MPRTTTITPISDQALGTFAVSDHSERVYKKVYYAIRERQGFLARKRNEDDFTWEDFKSKFAEVFGTPDNPQYTLEQLLDYALRKFDMTLQDLIEANNRSWERRRLWNQEQQSFPYSYSAKNQIAS